MLILGIESTAHTFGIGIIDTKKEEEKCILFNEKSQYREVDGMDLRKLLEFHVENFDSILIKAKKFLQKLNLDFNNIDLISFSIGPGLGNSLKVGALCAKTLALKYKTPIIGVNHIKAHLEIGKKLTGFSDPMFLYVSGVNTQIIAKDEFNKYKIYSETEDIGLGNLFDSFARYADLSFPGGPKIEKLALKSKNYIELPYNIKGMNISLAGTFSFLKQKLDSGEKLEDLCYSLQENSFAILLEVVERAIAYTKKCEFVIVGGVASNKRLTKMAKKMCEIRKIKYASFPMEYAMDNGAMIAWQGFVEIEKNNKYNLKKEDKINIFNLKPKPYINIESNF